MQQNGINTEAVAGAINLLEGALHRIEDGHSNADAMSAGRTILHTTVEYDYSRMADGRVELHGVPGVQKDISIAAQYLAPVCERAGWSADPFDRLIAWGIDVVPMYDRNNLQDAHTLIAKLRRKYGLPGGNFDGVLLPELRADHPANPAEQVTGDDGELEIKLYEQPVPINQQNAEGGMTNGKMDVGSKLLARPVRKTDKGQVGRRATHDPAVDKKLVVDCKASGMSQKEFERNRGIKTGSVRKAQWRINAREKKVPSSAL